jgi:hypothetical protein
VTVPPLSSPKVDSPVIHSFFTPCVTAVGRGGPRGREASAGTKRHVWWGRWARPAN